MSEDVEGGGAPAGKDSFEPTGGDVSQYEEQ